MGLLYKQKAPRAVYARGAPGAEENSTPAPGQSKHLLLADGKGVDDEYPGPNETHEPQVSKPPRPRRPPVETEVAPPDQQADQEEHYSDNEVGRDSYFV